VLFVSHNMTAVESFCNRGIYLERGRIAFDGEVREAVDTYLSSGSEGLQEGRGEYDLREVPRGPEVVQPVFRKVTVRDGRGRVTDTVRMGDELSLTIDLDGNYVRNTGITVMIRTEADRPVATLHSHMKSLQLYDEERGWEQAVLRLPHLPLLTGRYWVEVASRQGSNRVGRKITLDRVERAATFEVHTADVYGTGWHVGTAGTAGVVFLDQSWEIRSNGTVVAATEARG
jgi:lipopolysaccharide transport system ATP-binding protein